MDSPSDIAPAPPPRRPLRLVAVLGTIIAIGLVTWLQTGDDPSPVLTLTTQQPIPQFPDAASERLADGVSHLEDGDADEAGDFFANELAANRSDAYAQVGFAYSLVTQQPGRAVSIARDATTIDDEDAWLLLNLGTLELIVNGLDAAREELEDARDLGFADGTAPAAAVRAENLLYPDTAPDYPPVIADPVIDADPDAKALIQRLVNQTRDGNRPAALAEVDRVLGQDSDLTPSLESALILAGYRKQDPDATITALEALLPQLSEAPRIELDLGLAHLWAGNRDEGLGYLEKAAAAGAPTSQFAQQILDRFSAD